MWRRVNVGFHRQETSPGDCLLTPKGEESIYRTIFTSPHGKDHRVSIAAVGRGSRG